MINRYPEILPQIYDDYSVHIVDGELDIWDVDRWTTLECWLFHPEHVIEWKGEVE